MSSHPKNVGVLAIDIYFTPTCVQQVSLCKLLSKLKFILLVIWTVSDNVMLSFLFCSIFRENKMEEQKEFHAFSLEKCYAFRKMSVVSNLRSLLALSILNFILSGAFLFTNIKYSWFFYVIFYLLAFSSPAEVCLDYRRIKSVPCG